MAESVQNRQRVIDHGEVFTPPELVNDMLNLWLRMSVKQIDSRFLEPACVMAISWPEVLRPQAAVDC